MQVVTGVYRVNPVYYDIKDADEKVEP